MLFRSYHNSPAKSFSSSELSFKLSIANRLASGGDAGLCVGGVGSEAEGAGTDIRASNEGEC